MRVGTARRDRRDWALDDLDGEDPERVRENRDEVEGRIAAIGDEIGGSD